MAKQLNLFKAKNQRGVKAPSPLEFPIHCAVADTLRGFVLPNWIWFHCPTGEERPKKVNPRTGKLYSPAAERLQRMGARDGISDFLLIGPPTGTLHAYELKRLGHEPTDNQVRFGLEVVKAGGFFAWGDTYDHAIATFQLWGALPSTIKPQ